MHVGIEAGHDLDDGETLRFPIRRQSGELVGKVEAMTEAHPPGVAEPKEGGSVRMLEMTSVARNANGTVLEERVVPLVLGDLDTSLDPVQPLVGRVRALRPISVDSTSPRHTGPSRTRSPPRMRAPATIGPRAIGRGRRASIRTDQRVRRPLET